MRFLQSRKAGSSTEMGLMVGLIAVAITLGIQGAGSEINNVISTTQTSLQEASEAADARTTAATVEPDPADIALARAVLDPLPPNCPKNGYFVEPDGTLFLEIECHSVNPPGSLLRSTMRIKNQKIFDTVETVTPIN